MMDGAVGLLSNPEGRRSVILISVLCMWGEVLWRQGVERAKMGLRAED
jgi:hypothetical protein